jgi:hypothetical protein
MYIYINTKRSVAGVDKPTGRRTHYAMLEVDGSTSARPLSAVIVLTPVPISLVLAAGPRDSALSSFK